MEKQSVLQSLDFKTFYSRELPSLKTNGHGQAMALCPFHDDQKASLSVNLSSGLFFCHACGEKGDVFSFYQRKYGVDFQTALKEIAGVTETKRTISEVYNYRDEQGDIKYQVVRFTPKGFSQRKPDGNGGWIWNLNDVQLLPYNLPELIKSTYAFIVEGEKDCESLRKLGLVATTNAGGARKWRESFNQYFKGKRCYIIPDNDKTGKEHSLQVARGLKGIASKVKIIELQGLPEKGDVTDWIEIRQSEGKTIEAIKEELSEIVKTTPEWTEKEPDLLDSLLKWNDVAKLDVRTEYLVEKLLPEGSITLLFGRGGIGKTSLCLQLCWAIAEGQPFMGLQTTKTPVYYIDFENPLHVLKQRVELIGNTDNIFIWHLSGNPQPPRLDTKDWELYKKLPAGLLVFDTLRASQLGDENDSQDMSIIMSRLKELREAGFTVLLLHHTPKSNEGIYKGSTALLDLVDHCLSLEGIKDEESIEFGRDNVFRFGTRIKTRHEPDQIFLKFNPEMKGFELAKDPDDELMEGIKELLIAKGELNTNQIFDAVKKELDIKSKGQVLKLLKKGEGLHWKVETKGRAKLYGPMVQPIYSVDHWTDSHKNGPESNETESKQTLDNPIKSNSPEGIQTIGPYSNLSVQTDSKKTDGLDRCSYCMLSPEQRSLCEVRKPCPRELRGGSSHRQRQKRLPRGAGNVYG